MALAGALAAFLHTLTGQITDKSLRALAAPLLEDAPYSSARMSYDLRRLRMKGLIERVEGTNSYRITPDGIRFAMFYTKVHNRLLRPLMAADQPPRHHYAPVRRHRAARPVSRHARISPN
jgi:predicted MarR family transcription regulator